MAPRLQLHEILKSLVPGVMVYFQPPTNVSLQYPCIMYMKDGAKTEFADNNPHLFTQRYAVTVIDQDPDSIIPRLVAALPMCTFNRHFTADNLNHDVFNLYF